MAQTTEQMITGLTWYDLVNKEKALFTRVREENISTATLLEDVELIGTTDALTAVPATFADETAVQTYLVTLRSDTEDRLSTIETKIDALISALKTEV